MKTSIFLKSYSLDFPWLKYCLKSIEKHCKGFYEVVIVVPETDLPEIKSWGLTKEKIFGIDESASKDSYLFQQDVKLHADKYTDADFVMFVDSDCTFVRECSPEQMFIDSKPYMLITSYEVLGNDVPWKPITDKALKLDCKYETMRRLPFFYPTDILKSFREYFLKIHGITVTEYITRQPLKSFSEFNALGSYSYHFHHDRFFWWDTIKEPNLPESFINQEWSWGGLKPEIQRKLEALTV